MSKAEKFISDCTKNCSNEFEPKKAPPSVYNPWLTPNEARKAVEIAKEEILENVVNWIENNFSLYEGISGYHVAKELKQAMKDG